MVNCSWSAFIFFPPVSFKLLSSIIFSLLSPSTPTHHFQFCLPIILIAWFPTLGRTCPCHLSFFSSYLNFIAFKLLSDYTQFETLSILVIPCNLHILPPLLNSTHSSSPVPFLLPSFQQGTPMSWHIGLIAVLRVFPFLFGVILLSHTPASLRLFLQPVCMCSDLPRPL